MMLEQGWQERLLADLGQYEFVPRTTFLRNRGSKWRVASALQKAIRRGQTETAIRMANGLHGHEPGYVWRRLCTVVLEDIGVGDLDLCGRFLWVATRPAWRQANGGDLPLLYMLVEQMCAAAKDRNACDLPGWADMDPMLEAHRQAALDLSLEELTSLLVNPDVPLVNRALIFQALGHRDHPSFGKTEGFKAGLEALREAGFPELVLEVARMGRSKQYETPPYGIPLVWWLLQQAKTVEVVPDELIELPMIGSFPSSAFDMHNREGKRALKLFYDRCDPLREALIAAIPGSWEEHHHWSLGTLVFRTEGHQVDRRLVYDGAALIDRECTRAHLCHNFVPAQAQAELLALTREHLPLLHEIRLEVCLPRVSPPAQG
jgi:hypothetical protein